MFKFFIFIFLENNNIGHLLKISRDYFRSPPKKKGICRKEMDNISIIFCVHFRKCRSTDLLRLSCF